MQVMPATLFNSCC